MATIERSVLKIDQPEIQQGTTPQHRVRPLTPAASGGPDAGLANPNRSHSTPEALILLSDMVLGPSRRRRQQVKHLCNDIDAVNGPSVLLV
jgi:hypothetical protein